MSKRTKADHNFRELREWQDHQYDPGYWTFGRTMPLWRSTGARGRPNPFGYVLLLSGAAMLAFALALLIHALLATPTRLGADGAAIIFLGVLSAFLLSVGARLLRKRGPSRRRGTAADRPRRWPRA
jgi:hypothetical protein